MPQYNQQHHHSWLKSEIVELYISLAIKSFAFSLAGIFIPIYFLKLGYSLNIVFWYYFVMFAVFGVSALIVPKLSRIGLKHILIISMPFHIAFFVLLYTLNSINMNMIFSIAIVEGVAHGLYWVPIHSLFAKYSKKNKVSKQATFMLSMPRLVAMFGPIIGGIILYTFNFHVLIILSSLVMLVSLIPLFLTEEVRPNGKIDFKRMLEQDHKTFFWEYVIYGGISFAGAIVWPIFIFLMLQDYLILGVAGTIISLGVVTFPLVIGRLSKKISLESLIKISGFIAFLVFTAVSFVKNTWQIYVVSFFIGVVLIVTEVPVYSLAIEKVAKKHPLEYMLFREIALMIGRIIFILILLLIIDKLHVGFLVSRALSLLYIIL